MSNQEELYFPIVISKIYPDLNTLVGHIWEHEFHLSAADSLAESLEQELNKMYVCVSFCYTSPIVKVYQNEALEWVRSAEYCPIIRTKR